MIPHAPVWALAASVALRTKIIDEFIAFAINGGIDTVFNLGAGLDTRQYRRSG